MSAKLSGFCVKSIGYLSGNPIGYLDHKFLMTKGFIPNEPFQGN